MARITQIVLSEKDGAAESGDVGAFPQQLEAPGTVHGVAVHHRALYAVVANDQLFVDAHGRILKHQGLVALPFVVFAGGEQVDTCDLEFGGGNRALVASVT